MIEFISDTKSIGLTTFKEDENLKMGLIWSPRQTQIEWYFKKGPNKGNTLNFYITPKNNTSCYIIVYLPNLDGFEDVLKDDNIDWKAMMKQFPTLFKMLRNSKDKDNGKPFLVFAPELDPMDYMYDNKVWMGGILANNMPYPKSLDDAIRDLDDSSEDEEDESIDLLFTDLFAFNEEMSDFQKNGRKFDFSTIFKTAFKTSLGILIGIELGHLIDCIDFDFFDDSMSEIDFDYGNDMESVLEVDTGLEMDSVDQDADTHEHKKWSDISFTGYLGCFKCSCKGYIPGPHNICLRPGCGHKFTEHARASET